MSHEMFMIKIMHVYTSLYEKYVKETQNKPMETAPSATIIRGVGFNS